MATFQQKSVSADQISESVAFGWVRTKTPVPAEEASVNPNLVMVLKRKIEFANDPTISTAEREYYTIRNKVYKPKKVLFAIFTILWILCLLLTIVEVAIAVKNGITISKNAKPAENTEETNKESTEEASNAYLSQYLEKVSINLAGEETAAEETQKTTEAEETPAESTEQVSTIDKIFNKASEINNKVFGFALKLFADKTENGEVVEGLATKLGNMLGASVAPYISPETFLGVIFLVLFIIFLIIALACNKYKKKNRKLQQRREYLLEMASERVKELKKDNPYLMNKSERKMYFMENAIARGIIKAENYEGDDY